MTNQAPKPKYECPECRRVLYDRRKDRCLWCNCLLPKELLLTPEEIQKLNEESARLNREHHLWRLKQEDKIRDAKRWGANDDGSGGMWSV